MTKLRFDGQTIAERRELDVRLTDEGLFIPIEYSVVIRLKEFHKMFYLEFNVAICPDIVAGIKPLWNLAQPVVKGTIGHFHIVGDDMEPANVWSEVCEYRSCRQPEFVAFPVNT